MSWSKSIKKLFDEQSMVVVQLTLGVLSLVASLVGSGVGAFRAADQMKEAQEIKQEYNIESARQLSTLVQRVSDPATPENLRMVSVLAVCQTENDDMRGIAYAMALGFAHTCQERCETEQARREPEEPDQDPLFEECQVNCTMWAVIAGVEDPDCMRVVAADPTQKIGRCGKDGEKMPRQWSYPGLWAKCELPVKHLGFFDRYF